MSDRIAVGASVRMYEAINCRASGGRHVRPVAWYGPWRRSAFAITSGWLDNTSRCSPSCVACSSVRDKTRHVRCQTRTRSRRSDKCGSNHCHVASEFQKLCTWRAHEHDEGAGSWVGGHERVSRRGRLCHLTTCCLYSITLFYLMWR